MPHIDFLQPLHKSTKRDYLARVLEGNKAEFATAASKFGYDYWDGDRTTGYGGYTYDGRWKTIAEALIEHYDLKAGSRVLDVGCGKGFLLYEISQLVQGIELEGIDISEYAIEHAKEEIKPQLAVGDAAKLDGYSDQRYDLVLSINTLHNLEIPELWASLSNLSRIGKAGYIVMDAYRNEQERVNLMYWQLTCQSLFSVREWEWLFEQCGYTGDYSFVYFE